MTTKFVGRQRDSYIETIGPHKKLAQTLCKESVKKLAKEGLICLMFTDI